MSSPPPNSEPRIVGRHQRLVKRTVLVSALTLASRILGFVREVLSAMLFGDRSGIYDAFITAWRLPNLFRRFLGEGAISTALQTRLTEVDAERGDEAGRQLFLRTLGLAAIALVVVCTLVMALVAVAPDRLPILGWAWLGEDPGPVRELCLRLMPFVVLICLAALCGGALQVRGHFAAPAFAPAVMNVWWIGMLVGVGVAYGWSAGELDALQGAERHMEMARVLAWGVLAAGAIQLLVHVPALLRQGLLVRKADTPAGEPVRGAWDVFKSSAPLAFGAAVYQINVMVDGLMAEGLLRNGGPAAHYYANRIQQFPLALIAIAATSAVFPSLKALGHLGRKAELRALHDRTQLGIAFLALPASAGLLVLAPSMCSVLFEHGEYGPDGVQRMASALRMLGLALVPAGAVGLVSRCYYALDDFRTPVRVSAWMLLVNAGFNTLFVVGLKMDADGLALGTALASWGNLLWLWPGLARALGASGLELEAPSRVGRMLLASALAAGAAWAADHFLSEPLGPTLALCVAGPTGIGAYLGATRLCGLSAKRLLRPREGPESGLSARQGE